MRWFRSRVKPDKVGGVLLILSDTEREILRSLAPTVGELLDAPDDPAVARLFPAAYPDDQQREAEYRLLAGHELIDSHRAAMATFEESIDAKRLDADQAQAWLRALNELRLVIGTRLDVTDDHSNWPKDRDDPRLPAFAAYDYLSGLQDELVDALAESL